MKKWGSRSTGYGGGGGGYFRAIMKIYHDIVEAHYMNFGVFTFGTLGYTYFSKGCLHGGGGPHVGEVTRSGGVTRPSI